MARTRRAAAPAPAEPDDVFEDLDDTTEEAVEETPAPRKRAARTARATPDPKPAPEKTGPVYDTNWLAEHATNMLGREIDSRSVRMALRSLAADEDSVVERAVGEDRSRYDFSPGEKNATVKAVIAKLKAGPAPRGRRAASEDVEEAPAPSAPRKRTRAAAPAEVEEIEEPKPTRRRAAAKATTAPAKAAPATGTRRRRAANADA